MKYWLILLGYSVLISDMLNFPGYPTPPSTIEDSPVSYTTLSPAGYVSDVSSSPGTAQTQHKIVSPNIGIYYDPHSQQATTGNIQ